MKSSIQTPKSIEKELQSSGFSYFDGSTLMLPRHLYSARDEFVAEFDRLPADEFAGETIRRRRLG